MEEEQSPYELLSTGKPHVSFSEMSTWAKCSYKHYLQHVLKLGEDEASIFLTFGTAVHASLEKFLKTGVMDIAVALDIINEAYKEHGHLETFHRKNKQDEILAQAQKILIDFPLFLDAEFPGWKIIDAELPLYEQIDGKPHAFKGYVDAIITAPNKKGKLVYWVLDFKTTTSYWSREKKSDALIRAQLILYKNYVSQKLNIPFKDIRCAFCLLKRKTKPGQSIERVDVSVGDVTTGRSLKIVNNMLTSMNKNVAIKNRYDCMYCEFEHTEHCTLIPYGGRKSRQHSV